MVAERKSNEEEEMNVKWKLKPNVKHEKEIGAKVIIERIFIFIRFVDVGT